MHNGTQTLLHGMLQQDATIKKNYFTRVNELNAFTPAVVAR